MPFDTSTRVCSGVRPRGTCTDQQKAVTPVLATCWLAVFTACRQPSSIAPFSAISTLPVHNPLHDLSLFLR